MAGRRRRKFDRGRWAVERERSRIVDSRPPADDQLSSISETIPDVLKKLGLGDRLWEQNLLRDWKDLVGETVACHARPGRVDRGVLYVYVANSAWLHELRRYSEKQMLENIRARYGRRITSLRIQLDPDAGRA